MTGLDALLLPILLSAVFVFIASSVIHMVLPWHKNDLPPVPNEDKVIDALRPLAIPPGEYMLPRCTDRAQMKSPEFLEKMTKGPVMIMTVWRNGPPSMGRALGLWFLYLLVVGVFAGYITGRALGPGIDYLHVFRFAGAAAFMSYGLGIWQGFIWGGRPFNVTFKATIDSLVYAGVTAGTFGWLWPK